MTRLPPAAQVVLTVGLTILQRTRSVFWASLASAPRVPSPPPVCWSCRILFRVAGKLEPHESSICLCCFFRFKRENIWASYKAKIGLLAQPRFIVDGENLVTRSVYIASVKMTEPEAYVMKSNFRTRYWVTLLITVYSHYFLCEPNT